MPRNARRLVFNFAINTQTSSNACDLTGGAFGTLLCTSDVNTKTLQFQLQVEADNTLTAASVAAFNNRGLLAAAKTLATGANPLTADEIRALGGAGKVKLYLNSNVSAACQIVLLWQD